MKSLGFKLLVMAMMVGVLAYQVDLGQALLRLGTLGYVAVMVGLALSLAQIVALAFRWRLVSRLNGTSVPFAENLRCMLASQFFSQGLPATVGGDALRVWWLVRLGKSVRYALQSVLLDRIAGLVALVVVNTVSVSLLVTSLGGDASAWSIAWIVGGTLVATMAGASRFVRRLMLRLFLALPAPLRRKRGIAAFMRWLVRFHFSTGQLVFSAQGAVILGWGIAIHLCSVVLCLVVARDAGIGVSFLQLVAVVPPVMLLSYLPLSIGGWGLREGAMALALGMIGFPKEDGVFLGLALGSISLGAALLGALVWLFSPMPISLFGKPRGGAAMSLEEEAGKAR